METPTGSTESEHTTRHRVIILEGTGDRNLPAALIAPFWEKRFGLSAYSMTFGWKKGEEAFEENMEIFLQTVDRFLAAGEDVSIVAASGSALPALMTALNRPKIKRLVLINGRIQDGSCPSPLPAVRKAANLFKERWEGLSETEKEAITKKILVINSDRDERIPLDASSFPDERVQTVTNHTPLHALGIARPFFEAALGKENEMIQFLKGDDMNI